MCGKDLALVKDGTVRCHVDSNDNRYPRKWCRGSREEPATVKVTGYVWAPGRGTITRNAS